MPAELTFAAPRRAKPPVHLADLSMAERRTAVEALGEKGFRADQISRALAIDVAIESAVS